MTECETEILALLKQSPSISQQSIADQFGISRSAVADDLTSSHC